MKGLMLAMVMVAYAATEKPVVYVIKLPPPVIAAPKINYNDPNLMNDGRKPWGMNRAPDGSIREWDAKAFKEIK